MSYAQGVPPPEHNWVVNDSAWRPQGPNPEKQRVEEVCWNLLAGYGMHQEIVFFGLNPRIFFVCFLEPIVSF